MKKTEQKTIETKVLKGLTTNMTFSCITPKLITTYEFGNEQNIHMDIALIERGRVRSILVIEYDADEKQYDLWNFVNLDNYFRIHVLDKIYTTIHQINSENGHYEDNE